MRTPGRPRFRHLLGAIGAALPFVVVVSHQFAAHFKILRAVRDFAALIGLHMRATLEDNSWLVDLLAGVFGDPGRWLAIPLFWGAIGYLTGCPLDMVIAWRARRLRRRT